MASEREKMEKGEWYSCLDTELDSLRVKARFAVHEHNTLSPHERGSMAPKLRALFKQVDDGAFVEAPFHCSYGFNISLGENVYLNAGCTILDSAPVEIGRGSMLGPSVHIYCADHHRDIALRASGIERARPVIIGEDVWVGGGAIILPGLRIGNGAIVGAGSVVTKDVAAGDTVVGNPAHTVKKTL